jgi:hypothetical protein
VRVLKIPDISMAEFDKAFQDHFDVLKGEIMAGNSNEKIKQEYKQYIVRGMSEGIIPRTQGYKYSLFDAFIKKGFKDNMRYYDIR